MVDSRLLLACERHVNFSELDDTELMAHIVQGRDDALTTLYDRYSNLVYSMALRITGEQASAEEITLDVFQRVWERASLYDASKGSAATWLASMARNRGIDALRHARSRPAAVISETSADLDFDLSDHGDDSPEDQTEIGLERERVRAALAHLPGEQRMALYLAYFEGLSQREIGERLGEPLGTIKTRIRLGMQKLRALLENE